MKKWIDRLIAWYTNSKVRKFYHTEGFGDDTEYIEYFRGKVTCVAKNGLRTAVGPSLSYLEKWVEEGVYKEIK